MHVRIVKCDIPRFGGRFWLGIGPSRGCQRRTEFLYEAVKEQRYAVSRSHEETPKARQKQPQKNPKKKTNSWVAKESPTQEQKATAAGKKERKKETKEVSLCDNGPRSCSRRPSLREEASSTRDEEQQSLLHSCCTHIVILVQYCL